MTDDDIEMEVVISEAYFVGTCMRCKEPSTGSFNWDGDHYIKMRCVNCGFKTHLDIRSYQPFSFVVCGGDNG